MFKTFKKVFSILERYHEPTMLERFTHFTPFQQLVTALLSSRTKDTTTILIVKKLFAKYHNPKDFVKLKDKKLEELLFGIGFYKVKAKNIKRLAKRLIENFNSNVPCMFEELVSLPGVGRKTANCVLAYTFNKPAIAVDVHVHRISNRLGWVKTKTPEESEKELKRTIPEELWPNVNKLFVSHGQRICLPVGPKCPECPVSGHCRYFYSAVDRK